MTFTKPSPSPRVVRDRGVSVLAGVLVADRHSGRGVPEPVHELGQRGARLCSQYSSGVPQVMEAQLGSFCLLSGCVPGLLERGVPEVPSLGGAGEQQAVLARCGIDREMSLNRGE